MTAETTAGLAPAVAVPGAVGRRWPAVLLGLGGLLTAVGGSLHPHDAQETLTDTLVGLLSSPAWGTSHLLILAGVLLVVAGLAGARRERLFPDQVRGWLTVAIVCWASRSWSWSRTCSPARSTTRSRPARRPPC